MKSQHHSSNRPLQCKIEGQHLVIRIGISTLAWAFDHNLDNNPFDDKRQEFVQKQEVMDEAGFAKDVLIEITREEEDGSSPLIEFIDKMMANEVEQGSIWVIESGKVLKDL